MSQKEGPWAKKGMKKKKQPRPKKKKEVSGELRSKSMTNTPL